MKRNMKSDAISDRFFCTQCGHETLPVLRLPHQKREKGHLKNLYCPYCRTENNCVEVRSDCFNYTYADFMFEFTHHNFTVDGQRRMSYGELKNKFYMEE